MNLTKNGQDFFCNCTTTTFDTEDIIAAGITDNDLQILLEEDYINYHEEMDTYYWVDQGFAKQRLEE
jgi:hypothetical protein